MSQDKVGYYTKAFVSLLNEVSSCEPQDAAAIRVNFNALLKGGRPGRELMRKFSEVTAASKPNELDADELAMLLEEDKSPQIELDFPAQD